MSLIAPEGPVYQAGTLSGNPLAMAAGIATLKVLDRERPHRRLGELTQQLADAARDAAAAAGVAVRVNAVTGMFTIFFTPDPVTEFESAKKSDAARYGRFFHALLDAGVYFPPSRLEAAFVSTAFDAEACEHFVRALPAAFRAAVNS
jgi:glutamate-1-semialdehyde 2,1-aminomutase